MARKRKNTQASDDDSPANTSQRGGGSSSSSSKTKKKSSKSSATAGAAKSNHAPATSPLLVALGVVVLVTGIAVYAIQNDPALRKEVMEVVESLEHVSKSWMSSGEAEDGEATRATAAPGAETVEACKVEISKALRVSKEEEKEGVSVDVLLSCGESLKHASTAKLHWTVAAALERVGYRSAEIIRVMEVNAVQLQPANADCWRDLGNQYAAAGQLEKATTAYTNELALRMGVREWQEIETQLAAADVSPQRLLEYGQKELKSVSKLISLYVRLNWIPEALQAFRLYAVLFSSSAQVHRRFSTYAYSVGAFGEGLAHAMQDIELQMLHAQLAAGKNVSLGSDTRERVSQLVQEQGLLVLLTGLQPHTTSIARTLLRGSPEERKRTWDYIVADCRHVPKFPKTDFTTVSMHELKSLVRSCMVLDDVVKNLLDHKADAEAGNNFGWRPLHLAAAVGDEQLVKELLDADADVFALTTGEFTPLMVAAARGHARVVRMLVEAGSDVDATDMFDRDSRRIACANRWAATEVLKALYPHAGDEAIKNACTEFEFSRPRKCRSSRRRRKRSEDDEEELEDPTGGWNETPGRVAPELYNNIPEARQGVDCVDASQLELREYISEYLLLERPVLIKNALGNEHRSFWTRENVVKHFASSTEVPRARIPYADTFGEQATQTSLATFVQEYMRTEALDEDEPEYIFVSIPADTSLAKDLMPTPDWLANEGIGIDVRNYQLYVGGPGSGAPLHQHRAAYNCLMFGKKLWTLFPPKHGAYSTQHAHTWLKEASSTPHALDNAYQVVQEAGDILILPDFWTHSVVNLQEGVGYASEFIFGATAYAVDLDEADSEAE